jgi:hypothetical protein
MARPRTAAEEKYWVVQPLAEGSSWRDGFGRFFFNVPIARAEYEHPSESLKRLYDAAGGAPVIEAYRITADGTSRPVYFVGPKPGSTYEWRELPTCAGAMQLWLGTGGVTKMPCGFAECFHDATPQIPEWRGGTPIVAWWAIESTFMFALDPTVAENLLEAIHLEATTHATFRDY